MLVFNSEEPTVDHLLPVCFSTVNDPAHKTGDPAIRVHKTSDPAAVRLHKTSDPSVCLNKTGDLCVTCLHSSPTHLVVGTSAGVLLTIPLPYVEPSLEPHPLLHPPIPSPLYHGHVNTVHSLLVLQKEGMSLVITGGTGHVSGKIKSFQDIPDTSSCLLLWAFK